LTAGDSAPDGDVDEKPNRVLRILFEGPLLAELYGGKQTFVFNGPVGPGDAD
jgi:hypothetical protein